MTEQLTRREFLKDALVVGGGLVLAGAGLKVEQDNLQKKQLKETQLERLRKFQEAEARKDKVFHIEMDEDNAHLSFNEARDLTLYFDKVSDLLPPPPEIPLTQTNMELFTIEVLPFMKAEGVIDDVVWPTIVKLQVWDDERHILVGGQSDCNLWTKINFRNANPFSPFYGDLEWMSTQIHELVHIQQKELLDQKQACTRETTENTENTAQIVSWEVMSALLHWGDKKMIYPLLDELKGRFLGTTLFLSWKEKRQEEYLELAQKVNPGAMSVARRDKINRYWRGNEKTREEILTKYGLHPLEKVVYAIKEDFCNIDGLALPPVRFYWFTPPHPRTFKVDDLAYFIKNAEPIAMQIAQEGI